MKVAIRCWRKYRRITERVFAECGGRGERRLRRGEVSAERTGGFGRGAAEQRECGTEICRACGYLRFSYFSRRKCQAWRFSAAGPISRRSELQTRMSRNGLNGMIEVAAPFARALTGPLTVIQQVIDLKVRERTIQGLKPGLMAQ